MNYPLEFRFKIIAMAPQIYVLDANGNTLCYVKQKMFKLKEAIEVYTDDTKSTLFANIAADRILDFSAAYTFTNPQGQAFGQVRRKGMRSIWKSHYEIITQGDTVDYVIEEANPWVKVADAMLDAIPLIGLASNYLFHPKYELKRPDGEVLMVLEKQPAMFEGVFKLNKVGEGVDDTVALLSFLMMTLLERAKG